MLSAAGLAEYAGLEAPTVAKVLWKPLAQAGLVRAFRGVSGVPAGALPARITLVEIVEAMEGPLGMT